MSRIVLVNDREYDVDADRARAQQALLDAGEREARVYLREGDELHLTITVLRDSGTLHEVGR